MQHIKTIAVYLLLHALAAIAWVQGKCTRQQNKH